MMSPEYRLVWPAVPDDVRETSWGEPSRTMARPVDQMCFRKKI
jgi:hypothetical protein